MERTTNARCFKEACKLGATAIMLLDTVGVKQVTNFGVKLNMHLLNRPYRDPPALETSRSRRLSAHHACIDVPRLVAKNQADGHQWESSITCKPTQVDTTFFMSITAQHNATLQFKLRKLNVALETLHGHSKFDSSHMNPFALRQNTRTSERFVVQRNLLLRPQRDWNYEIPTLSWAIRWEIWAMSSVGTSGSTLDLTG